MTTTKTVVIYDGECNFCCWCAQLLKRWDKEKRLQIVTAERALNLRLHPQLTSERCQQALQVILPNGQLLEGWDGLMAAFSQLPLLRWFGFFGRLPLMRILGDKIYRIVAANRCKLGCQFSKRSKRHNTLD
ncbi:MAG: DUF393 domain-containing protein [Armatimonadetes bacterium]|nr:DUF393 domain-containing protein [Armatimonadota bacterium]MDW8026806.1 DUF393 domain-containing protein [Armatimonadota bacterium]